MLDWCQINSVRRGGGGGWGWEGVDFTFAQKIDVTFLQDSAPETMSATYFLTHYGQGAVSI